MQTNSRPDNHPRHKADAHSYYLTDIGPLNEIYQAAKRVLIQPDNFTLSQLATAIHQAEEVMR